MRTFIAVSLPDHTKEALAAIIRQLRSTGADVKWVDPASLHLTLKFLGEIAEEQLPALRDALERTARRHEPFTIQVRGIGAFPSVFAARIIWAGITDGKEETKRLAQDLEEELLPLGFAKEERPFSAHLTLGRSRSNLNRSVLTAKLVSCKDDAFAGADSVAVNAITLYRSTLTPRGALYEAIGQANLKTP